MAFDPAHAFPTIASDSSSIKTSVSTGTEGRLIDFVPHRDIDLRVRALRKLYELHDNWDGYGSVAPKTSAVNMALRALPGLFDAQKPQPNTIKPDGEGGVSLIWTTGGARIIFTFDGAEIHMSREAADGTIELPDPVPYFSSSSAELPTVILDLIR